MGWTIAEGARLERRDRAIVALAGIAPDLDGFGFLPELLTRGTPYEVFWWSEYHHTLGHNVGFAALCTLVAFLAARSRLRTAGLACLSFHLHLLGDVIGARGPDGFQWPVPYLLPWSDAWQWTWDGQWALNAWPNIALTLVLLALTFRWAWKRGHSPLEMLSRRADAAFVRTLRSRFGEP